MELVSISINLVCTISRRSNSKIHIVSVNFICYIIFITLHVPQLYWVSRAKLPQSLNTPASILTPSLWG